MPRKKLLILVPPVSLPALMALFVLMTLFAPTTLCAADRVQQPAPPLLEVMLREAHDSAKVEIDGFTALVDITSKDGISAATIERKSLNWPLKLTVRISISVMEGFSASCGDLGVDGSLGFGKETFEGKVPIKKHLDEGDGSATAGEAMLRIRKTNKGVEIDIPAELLDVRQNQLEIGWIDAFRG